MSTLEYYTRNLESRVCQKLSTIEDKIQGILTIEKQINMLPNLEGYMKVCFIVIINLFY